MRGWSPAWRSTLWTEETSQRVSSDETLFPVDRKFLTASDKDNLFTIDHFPLWYRLAVENTPGSFYYFPINDKGPSVG